MIGRPHHCPWLSNMPMTFHFTAGSALQRLQTDSLQQQEARRYHVLAGTQCIGVPIRQCSTAMVNAVEKHCHTFAPAWPICFHVFQSVIAGCASTQHQAGNCSTNQLTNALFLLPKDVRHQLRSLCGAHMHHHDTCHGRYSCVDQVVNMCLGPYAVTAGSTL